MGKTYKKNDNYSMKYAKFVPKKKFKVNKHKIKTETPEFEDYQNEESK